MVLFHSLLPLCGLLATCTAYVPLPPSDDAFYQPPYRYELERPESILRPRQLPKPFGINATIAKTHQLLYRSTDSQGKPNAVVTTVLVPPNAHPNKLLSLQNAYDSAFIDCPPSYQLYQPDSFIYEREIIELALQEGWYVSVPDFEGFTSAFTNGVQSGQAVLDSLRAVLRSRSITGLSSNARKVMAGGSGGALGSEWALELQATYSPELTIEGTLLTALTPNVSSVFETVEGTNSSSVIPLAMLGLSKQYPNLSRWISDNLQPLSAPGFLEANKVCGANLQPIFQTQQVSSKYFGRPNAFLDATPQSVLHSVGTMGLHGTPRSPIFSCKGEADELSPIADTDALINKYCDKGVTVQYLRVAKADHEIGGAYGFVAGFPWLKDRLNGVRLPAGCNITNITLPAGFPA
ncbi:hypothetical protein M409DRAFT_66618 [Zasmidium cellare ATCC 36951]|uniref:Uncharacterized protein n=1 Tax=Zasmidium cellare ATCC 36951 TaxID=1080233 RepID=A0A6A6CHF1_ZASCE|nr:uncharacterized protein M409DRAFT_66618 [Zasmidium cellare ATCC 36951]KAF2166624.1 hypothetical protein M409DRAFT_66618 [Zasmidium cellare ATCC 36951]